MLREVLLSGNDPDCLDLNVSHNNMGSEGYKLLQDVLADPRCPTGLRIQINADNVQADRYRCVVIEQGRRQMDIHLSAMPPEIWDQVYSYLNPYIRSDIRYPSFSRKVVQVVDKADKDSLILRLKYLVNFFEPNAYVALEGEEDKTITEASPLGVNGMGSLFHKPQAVSAITTQLINELQQLIARSMVEEDIRPILQEMLDNYVANINSNNNSEAATVEPLINYRLLEYEQFKNYKKLSDNKVDDNNPHMEEAKQQNRPSDNNQSSKRTYSIFKLFDNILPHTSSADKASESDEERSVKRMALERK